MITRSTQRAQTSAERQHNRIAEWLLQGICSVCWRGSSSWIRNGLPDPDSDADRHQNVISWSLGHIPDLQKISSKSVGNFFDYPVNLDFGLWTPGSGQWSRSSPKLNSLVPWPCPTPPRNFVKIRSELFQLSDGQTNRPKWKQPCSSAEVMITMIISRTMFMVLSSARVHPVNSCTFARWRQQMQCLLL